MKTCLLALCLIVIAQSYGMTVPPTTQAPHHEKPEFDSVQFNYDGVTHIMQVISDGKCYLNMMSQQEVTSIHTDAGLRSVEMRVLGIMDRAFFTSVPQQILNPSLLRGCGKMSHAYYLVH